MLVRLGFRARASLAAPATIGEAKGVPEMVVYSLFIHVVVMFSPGAERST